MTNRSRHAILIAGMHRSGTSAFARVANLLGAEIGSELMPAAPGNPRGYWEEKAVVELNEECLRSFDLSWDDPSPLPSDWLGAPWMNAWRDRLATLLRRAHPSASLIVIKDPRICRLLPAWLQVLESLELTPHVVVAVRPPGEVAASLERRDGLPMAHGKQLWLTYLLDVELASRSVQRAFVSFSDLLQDWQALALRLQSELGINWPVTMADATPQVETFLNAGMRHGGRGAPTNPTAAQTSLLAATAYAYARASSDGHVVPARCWDETRHAFEKHLRDTPSTSEYSSRSASAASPLGLWEPAEVVSEVVQARLYFRAANEAADEGRHVAAVVSTAAKPMHAEFQLPTGAHVDFIRFDPATRRGIYRVLEVKVNGYALASTDVKLSAVRERLLPNEPGTLLSFFSDDDDPFIEFDMRGFPSPDDKPLRVAFTFECDSLFDRFQREAEQRKRGLSDKMTQLQHALAGVSAKLAVAETAQHAVQKDLANLQAASDIARRRDEVRLQSKLVDEGWDHTGPWQTRPRTAGMLGRATRLRPIPSQHLQLLGQYPGSKSLWWRVGDDRPSFVLEFPEKTALSAGLYMLSMNLSSVNEHTLRPQVEIDYDDDSGDAERIDMVLAPGARSHILLRFKRPTHGLRFYPGAEANTEFLLSLPHVRRCSRIGAALRLVLPWVRRMRSDGNGWGMIWRQGWRALMRKDN